MNIFKKMYCRVFQWFFRIILPILPYKEPKILNSIKEISVLLKQKNINNVLLITDCGIRNLGITQELESTLASNGQNCFVYDKTNANPTAHNVEEAREMFIVNNCKCIIAFGGGSSIDCAKAVGARIAYPKKSLNKLKGLLKVKRKIPTLIAIPTTAGTGSETTLTAVITDSQTKHKYTMNSFSLIPSYAVLDANVTKTLPPSLTATTGMDALTHSVEAYIGKSTTRFTRKMALKSIKLIYENILTAYNHGNNLQARQNMLKASYMAGLAFSRSYVGYIHSIAHSLGGQYNTPHGLANAVIMPYVLKMYGKSCHKKLHQIAVMLGICDKQESKQTGAEKFINFINELNNKMQIPNKIKGIIKSDIPMLATHADKEANPLYPVPKLFNAKKLQEIYYLIAE